MALAVRVAWTDNALAHLQSIHDYVALDSPRYAVAVTDRITSRAKQCGVFPQAGSRVREFDDDDDVREVLEHPYRIIYRIMPDRVDVLAVVHGARHLPTLRP